MTYNPLQGWFGAMPQSSDQLVLSTPGPDVDVDMSRRDTGSESLQLWYTTEVSGDETGPEYLVVLHWVNDTDDMIPVDYLITPR